MNYQGNGMFKQLLECGIDLTIEPFFRKQLLSLYRFHVKEVKCAIKMFFLRDPFFPRISIKLKDRFITKHHPYLGAGEDAYSDAS